MITLLKTMDGDFINLDYVVSIYRDHKANEERQYETDEEILDDLRCTIVANSVEPWHLNYTTRREMNNGKYQMYNNGHETQQAYLFHGNKEDSDRWFEQFEFTMSIKSDKSVRIVDINAILKEAKELEQKEYRK